MSSIKGSTILITGGNSGIGKEVAAKVLALGAKTVGLWGTDQYKVNSTLEEFRQKGYKTYGYAADISDTQKVLETAAKVIEEIGLPDILINNAGIVAGKLFWEHSYAEIEKIIGTNVTGTMTVTRAFLPSILKRGYGHILNNSSAVGIIPNPRMSVYASSKWAMLGWSESLRLELEAVSRDFHVTTVTTSYVDTGMFENVKAPLLTPILKVDYVAESIVKAIQKNKSIVRLPFSTNFLPLLRGLLPTRMFDFLIGHGLRVYSSMNSFTGKQEIAPDKKLQIEIMGNV